VQVNSSPDIASYGVGVVTALSRATHSEDLLNRVLVSAACAGRLSQLISHLLRYVSLTTLENTENLLGMFHTFS